MDSLQPLLTDCRIAVVCEGPFCGFSEVHLSNAKTAKVHAARVPLRWRSTEESSTLPGENGTRRRTSMGRRSAVGVLRDRGAMLTSLSTPKEKDEWMLSPCRTPAYPER